MTVFPRAALIALVIAGVIATTAEAQTLADKIAGGATFTVTFLNILPVPDGHIGTIYPGTTLTGTYNRGTQAWHVWGPNSQDHHFVDTSYCPNGCPGHDSGTYDPGDHKLELWGAGFTFDDDGNVYTPVMGGTAKVGIITAQ
jgi:hypothetical protein